MDSPPRAKDRDPAGEGMGEDPQDMELDEATLPDRGRPKVLEMEREEFGKLEFQDEADGKVACKRMKRAA